MKAMLNKMDNNELLDMDMYEDAHIIDLDGEPFEIIGELEHEGGEYLALIAYTPDDEDDIGDDTQDEQVEFVILKQEQGQNDEEYYLSTIDDDELYEKIGEMFLKQFASQDEQEVQ
jgi:uncharacterized protein YrzB (UPF0473 family)